MNTAIRYKQLESHPSKENCRLQCHLWEHARRETRHRDEQQLQPTWCHPAWWFWKAQWEHPMVIHLGQLLEVSLHVEALLWDRFPRGEAVLLQLPYMHSCSKDTIFSWSIPPGFTLADNLLRNVQHLPYVKVNPRARCLGVHYTKLRPQLKESQTIIPRDCGDQVLAGR